MTINKPCHTPWLKVSNWPSCPGELLKFRRKNAKKKEVIKDSPIVKGILADFIFSSVMPIPSIHGFWKSIGPYHINPTKVGINTAMIIDKILTFSILRRFVWFKIGDLINPIEIASFSIFIVEPKQHL